MNSLARRPHQIAIQAERGGDFARLVGHHAHGGINPSLTIFSGVLAATSSISMPPSVLAIMTGRETARSSKTAK